VTLTKETHDDAEAPSSSPHEESYRAAIKWERVASVTHCVDCYPEACPFKAYIAGDRVLREEQSGIFQTVEEGVPDMNPSGCQKGAGWSRMLDAPERVQYPLIRDASAQRPLAPRLVG